MKEGGTERKRERERERERGGGENPFIITCPCLSSATRKKQETREYFPVGGAAVVGKLATALKLASKDASLTFFASEHKPPKS